MVNLSITFNKVTIMRKLLYSVALLLFCSSCNKELKEPAKIKVNVSPETEGVVFHGDTAFVKSGTNVVFDFAGNHDFVTMYSGEPGSVYEYRNRTHISKEFIASSKLKFSITPLYGVIPNTMSVYLKPDFAGLNGKDYKQDLELIEKTEWIDITALCNLPEKSNSTSNVELDMVDYMDKPISIAFRYETTQNSSTQPRWDIKGLTIENQFIDGTGSEVTSPSFSFSAFDVLNPDAAYAVNTGAGVWNLAKNNFSDMLIQMPSSKAGEPKNLDWLISSPMDLSTTTPDKGVAIKDITERLPQYKYVYNRPGKYKVTFVANNVNFDYSSNAICELNLVVE